MSYNFSDETYRNMLASFRSNDLQSLLGSVGRNRAGRKSELKDRALELLRNRPIGFNLQAYLTKIVEIYRSVQSNNADVPNNNDVLRNMMHNQQQIISMQTQRQRMYQTPQYSPQQMQITRAGLPQVMPQIQRSIYGNSNITGSNSIQYNYHSTAPRSVVHQIPVNQQLGSLVTQDQVGYDMNSTSLNSNFVPPTLPLTNVKFRKLPFYEVHYEVAKPSTLIGQERCSLPNFPRGMREAAFKFNLQTNNCSDIALNRDCTKNDYEYQLQIRICLLETGATEIQDYMPLGLHIRVNSKVCPLPPTAPNTRPGTEARRTPRPINCSSLLKINPTSQNNITVNWTPDGKTYVLGVYLVKKLSSEILLQKLLDKGARSSDETKHNIIQKLADVDPDLATTSYRFSLVCPLGKMRMKIPAKSINCDHLQCFDASIFILMNEKKPTWMCPTCSKSCFYDDIQIESYFLDIVTSPSLPDSCKEIEILADGTWRVYEEPKEDVNMENTINNKEKQIDSVDLDDSDDGGNDDNPTDEVKKGTKPGSSKESENLKSSFVDLTISDDEELQREKNKQENEAQAADATQIVTTMVSLKPQAQAQVQPQQAVTSSEQGVVIEVDSPSPPPRAPTPETLAS